ncbi:MAG: AI-2E family transporter [Propionibacteriaceae bacterium]|jgi:predicted PurR-regulated permease PerM|nr:AI-2E family transporter [Propionibacteriaceae bacterium]
MPSPAPSLETPTPGELEAPTPEGLAAAPEDTERSRSTRLPQGLSVLIGLACLLIIAQNTRDLQSILAAAFMALNLVIVVWPIQRLLARVIPGVLASLMAGLTAAAILVGLIYALGWAITRLVQELPHYSGQFQNMINQIADFADRHGVDTNTIINQAIHQLQNINVSTIVSALSSIASNISSAIVLIALIIMILIFMIMDSTGFSDRMARLAERHNPTLAWALTSFSRGARRYWVMATVFGLVVAGFDLVLLAALSVPLALVWAVFSFVTNYIPTIGFVLGLIPPVVMALLANGPITALWVAIGYSALNVVIQGFIQPRMTGQSVGITATLSVLSLLIWSYVLGALGALLAIPATLLVKTLFIDIDPKARWVNTLIASDPDTSEQDPIKLSDLLDRAKSLRPFASRAAQSSAPLVQAAQAVELAAGAQAGLAASATSSASPAEADPSDQASSN